MRDVPEIHVLSTVLEDTHGILRFSYGEEGRSRIGDELRLHNDKNVEK